MNGGQGADEPAMDCALDYCCLRRSGPREARPVDEKFVEVCLRCGHSYEGVLLQVIVERKAHLCDPSRRKPIPEWALAGRKYDRSES